MPEVVCRCHCLWLVARLKKGPAGARPLRHVPWHVRMSTWVVCRRFGHTVLLGRGRLPAGARCIERGKLPVGIIYCSCRAPHFRIGMGKSTSCSWTRQPRSVPDTTSSVCKLRRSRDLFWSRLQWALFYVSRRHVFSACLSSCVVIRRVGTLPRQHLYVSLYFSPIADHDEPTNEGSDHYVTLPFRKSELLSPHWAD